MNGNKKYVKDWIIESSKPTFVPIPRIHLGTCSSEVTLGHPSDITPIKDLSDSMLRGLFTFD